MNALEKRKVTQLTQSYVLRREWPPALGSLEEVRQKPERLARPLEDFHQKLRQSSPSTGRFRKKSYSQREKVLYIGSEEIFTMSPGVTGNDSRGEPGNWRKSERGGGVGWIFLKCHVFSFFFSCFRLNGGLKVKTSGMIVLAWVYKLSLKFLPTKNVSKVLLPFWLFPIGIKI